MKVVQVLGPGCPKCFALARNAQAAIDALGLDAMVEKVTDIQAMISFGIMTTPALAVDGKVRSVGKVLSSAEIQRLLGGS